MPDPSERTFDELLAALAERTPAPAGGCATAWAGAIAAALVEMTAAYAGDAAAGARARELRVALLHAAAVDQHCYEPVLTALRLPRADPSREHELRTALARAAEPPLAMAEAVAEIARLGADVRGRLRPEVAQDAVTGTLLAAAAAGCAERLVLANLAGQPADEQRARLASAAERARAAGSDVVGNSAAP